MKTPINPTQQQVMNWGWIVVFAYFFQASVMAPAPGQLNHWAINQLWEGLVKLPASGQGLQKSINEWSIRRYGSPDELPAEDCQTPMVEGEGVITFQQYTALQNTNSPSIGDVQRLLGESYACTTISGAHRYLADWEPGTAIDISYPAEAGFEARIEKNSAGTTSERTGPDAGLGVGSPTDQP